MLKMPSNKFSEQMCNKEPISLKLLARLNMMDIENIVLRRRCRELRNQKVQTNHILDMLKKENEQLRAKINDGSWIKIEEQNSQFIIIMDNIKDSLKIYKGILEKNNTIFKNIKKYMQQMEKNNSDSKKLIETLNEKTYLDKPELIKIKKAEDTIDKIINDHKNSQKYIKSDTIRLKDTEYLSMKIRIEELKDEVKLCGKWRNLCMNLLSLSSLNPSQISTEKAIGQIFEPIKGLEAIQILKRDAEELQEELIRKEMINIDLDDMKLENKSLKAKLCKLKGVSQQKDVDDVIYKMSLIILKKYTEDEFTDKNLDLIKGIFGDTLVKEYNNQKTEIETIRLNCKSMMKNIFWMVLFIPDYITMNLKKSLIDTKRISII